MKPGWIIAATVLLAGCNQGVSGTYSDQMGVSRYTFGSRGAVTLEMMGVARQSSYQRDGDVVRIQLPDSDASLEFRMGPDGALTGPMGVRLEKVVE